MAYRKWFTCTCGQQYLWDPEDAAKGFVAVPAKPRASRKESSGKEMRRTILANKADRDEAILRELSEYNRNLKSQRSAEQGGKPEPQAFPDARSREEFFEHWEPDEDEYGDEDEGGGA